jgi:hypothetical protein
MEGGLMSNELVVTLVPGPGTASQDMGDWLRDHDLDPNDVVKIEVFQQDCIAYRHARNEKGKKFLVNKEKGIVAEQDPFRFDRKRPIPDVG